MTEKHSPKYIHGYLEEEQERLRHQALVIERPIYDYIDFSENKNLLEIGSGVGAQTEILLRRFPQLHITGVEYEPKQIAKAEKNMQDLGYTAPRVQFIQQDAKDLQLSEKYDAAFICWVLEHISDPIQVLHSMKTCLLPGAKVVITEVFNATFYTFPEMPTVKKYWQIYNDYQVQIGGDPQVGARLGDLLEIAGYRAKSLRSGGFHLDSRNPEDRNTVMTYWKNLMSSGAPALLEEGLIDQNLLLQMQAEMDQLKAQKDAVFYYRFIQATAFV
ncbi:Methyltransferase domain-containing protein [Belliella buryatensis]|uniref:Methyltransferase domain-containing protein n=1 Tax=Belliella buryatensis TaxID=1500549 RepID=A0A239EA61_9BACT|nr:class I SAM-dependent methyltransferase [Belliella buryatensis]SNS41369.1 Methyltransferase domain-containing protein [Belliella buryatensis]